MYSTDNRLVLWKNYLVTSPTSNLFGISTETAGRSDRYTINASWSCICYLVMDRRLISSRRMLPPYIQTLPIPNSDTSCSHCCTVWNSVGTIYNSARKLHDSCLLAVRIQSYPRIQVPITYSLTWYCCLWSLLLLKHWLALFVVVALLFGCMFIVFTYRILRVHTYTPGLLFLKWRLRVPTPALLDRSPWSIC